MGLPQRRRGTGGARAVHLWPPSPRLQLPRIELHLSSTVSDDGPEDYPKQENPIAKSRKILSPVPDFTDTCCHLSFTSA